MFQVKIGIESVFTLVIFLLIHILVLKLWEVYVKILECLSSYVLFDGKTVKSKRNDFIGM